MKRRQNNYTWRWKQKIKKKKRNPNYLTVRPNPTVNVKNGTLSLSKVQYHVANVAAKTISPNAEMKNRPQKKPNTL